MRLSTRIGATLALCTLATIAPGAEAAVGCTLDNPEEDIRRFFPDFSDFRTQTLSFAVQDPSAHATLARRLGDALDPLYERSDVPYALYSVNAKGERLGYAFGTNVRGTYSNIQVVALTDAEGRLIEVYIQKLRSPEHAALTSPAFLESLREIPFKAFTTFSTCFTGGRCEALPIADPTKGREGKDFRAILRALAKLYHLSDLLLKPGETPEYRDPKARAEYISELFIPEQGFTPLDAPPKVSLSLAEEHVLDRESLVVAFVRQGEVTLYPVSLLTLHPVIQDGPGGAPFTLAWSSASHTLSVLRSVGAKTLRFSHTLNVLFNQQTMVERDSRSEWSALLGAPLRREASTEEVLTHVPGASLLPWHVARRIYPSARVATPKDPLSRHKELYRAHRARFDVPAREQRVVVLQLEGSAHPIRKETLAALPFYQARVGSSDVLVVSEWGGRAAYSARLDGKTLRFELHGRDLETGVGLLRDLDTGSLWEGLSGRAISGPRQGASLTPLVFHEMPEASARAFFKAKL